MVKSLPFRRHHAFIIGIDAYENPAVPRLDTAVNDASRLADVLGDQSFEVHLFLNSKGEELRALLRTTLPQIVGAGDRVVFYFAGHGIAETSDGRPAGYIVPADYDRTDASLLPMAELQTALNDLPCRHLLLILDCCFSGAFKWSSKTRSIGSTVPKVLYQERFDRFLADPAWQVITSTAADQTALDALSNDHPHRVFGDRGLHTTPDSQAHSPFAIALFEGLGGYADAQGGSTVDGVITATKLYCYLRDQVEPESIAEGQRLRQTPGIFPLEKHDKGEFIFLNPRCPLNLPSLTRDSPSPYRGMAPFEEEDRWLFYGRDRVIAEIESLSESLNELKLLVITGDSGAGKSSVVMAGLVPAWRAAGRRILPVIRPASGALAALDQALDAAHRPATGGDASRSILVVDQCEELIMRCADPVERQAFMARLQQALADPAIDRIVLTVRADYESRFAGGAWQEAWKRGRYLLLPPTLEELKEIIVMPARQDVLDFDPPSVVDRMIEEVKYSPGPLALLSCALGDLYAAAIASGRQDRFLRLEDYDKIGGVAGSLCARAATLYGSLDAAGQETLRKVLLRLVATAGERQSRRVPMVEFDYPADENPSAAAAIERLIHSCLIVKSVDAVSLIHDPLVSSWKTLNDWVFEVGKDALNRGAQLYAAATDYAESRNREFLWSDNPYLPVLRKQLDAPHRWFNALEVAFVAKSVAHRERRLRLWIAGAATIGLLLLALAVAAWSQRNQAVAQYKRAMANNLALLSSQTYAQGDPTRALRLVELAYDIDPAHAPPAVDRVLRDEYTGAGRDGFALNRLILQQGGDVNAGAFSPDGKHLVTAAEDGSATLWDGNGRATARLQHCTESPRHCAAIKSVAFSHDGNHIITVGAEHLVKMWDAQGRYLKDLIGHDCARSFCNVAAVALAPDDQSIVTVGDDEAVILWNYDGRQIKIFDQHRGANGWVKTVAFSPDGKHFATGGGDWDRSVQLYQVADGTAAHVDTMKLDRCGEDSYNCGIYSIAFSRDKPFILVASEAPTIHRYDYQSRRSSVFRGHLARVNSVAFSPTDPDTFVSASDDGTAALWRTNSPAPRVILRGHTDHVTAAEFSPDGRFILTASNDRTARLWDLQGHTIAIYAGHHAIVRAAHFAPAPDWRQVLTTSQDNTARLWNLEPIPYPTLPTDAEVVAARFLPDGKRILTASNDLRVRLWEVDDHPRLLETYAPVFGPDGYGNKGIFSLDASSDGKRFVTTGTDYSVRIWDTETGQVLQQWEDPGGCDGQGWCGPDQARFSWDGKYLVTADHSGAVKIYAADGKQIDGFQAHDHEVDALAITRDDRWLATGSHDGTIKIWTFPGGELQRTLTRHTAQISGLEFSAAGDRLVSASFDHTARLWDLQGNPLLRIDAHDENVRSVEFSPDMQQLITSSADNTAKVWDLQGHLIATLRGHEKYLNSASFAPTGDRYLTASGDHSARVWLTSESIHRWLETAKIYRLTAEEERALKGGD